MHATDLWRLIECEAESIRKYFEALGYLASLSTAEPDPAVETLQKIIAAKRDHMEALKYLLNTSIKEKPATDMTDFAKQAFADYKERSKLIK